MASTDGGNQRLGLWTLLLFLLLAFVATNALMFVALARLISSPLPS